MKPRKEDETKSAYSVITKITRNRAYKISKELLNKSFFVYNGKRSTYLTINQSMINHKFGEFALTKYTGSRIHNSIRAQKRKNKKKKK